MIVVVVVLLLLLLVGCRRGIRRMMATTITTTHSMRVGVVGRRRIPMSDMHRTILIGCE